MNNKGLVSVCIITYKHEKFIKPCIESILGQTYKNFELIILDDGSPDDTFKIAKECTQNATQKCIVQTQNNTGHISRNLNNLLKNATGEFIYLISGDDILLPQSLEKMVNILNEDENIQFCFSERIQIINDDGNATGKMSNSPFYEKTHKNVTIRELFESEITISGAFYVQSALFRKSIIDVVGGYEEDMLGDDIVIRTKVFMHMLQNPQMQFRMINESIFLYRMHETNIHNNVERQVETIYQVQEKYGNFLNTNLKSKHILPWSLHGVNQYINKINHFVLHECNKENRNKIISHIINSYTPLYTDSEHLKNVPYEIKFKHIKYYIKNKIKRLFKK